MNLAFFAFLIFASNSCNKVIEKSNIIYLADSSHIKTSNAFRMPWFSIIKINDDSYICNFDEKKKLLNAFVLNRSESLTKDKILKIDNWVERAYFHNYDSIFIINQHTGQIKIINFKGQIIDSMVIPLVINGIKRMICYHSPNYFKLDNNKLLLTSFPYVKLEEFYNHPMELIYSITDHKIEAMFLKFPITYQYLKDWGGIGMNFTKCINQAGDIYYNFPFENKILKYSNNILSSIEMPFSSYFNNFPPPHANDDSLMFSKYVIEFANTSNYYYSIIYDKFRDYYLRIVAHSQNSQSIDSTGNVTFNQYNDRNWSIMLFDYNFKLLGEQLFSGKKYNFESVMVSSNGIYIGETPQETLDSTKVYKFYLFKYEK